jgi:hypothetical protein
MTCRNDSRIGIGIVIGIYISKLAIVNLASFFIRDTKPYLFKTSLSCDAVHLNAYLGFLK